ncbi:MAG TPA: hypothetical protein VJU86_07865 [Pyrinomonadaceae bacterium]|nr:hypothetical protein [Pyrinomonadaceae bacterium]
MKKLVASSILSLLFAVSSFAVGLQPPKEPARDILGVRIGMSADEAHTQLKKIGELQKEERKRQEVWAIRDPRFSHLIVQFEKGTRLIHFVTAVARADAQAEKMRYSDVGELKSARQRGEAAKKNYRYEWGLEAAGKDPKVQIVAWGRDPQYLQYYSIERAN